LSPFPCFFGTTRRSDSLTTLPPGFVLLRRSGTTATRLSLSWVSGAHLPRARVVDRLPQPASDVESSGPPRFLGDPLVHVPRSSTPARPRSQAFAAPRCCLPLVQRRRLSRRSNFRGSITRPAHWLSTLRSSGCPDTTQDSLPAGGLLCRAGFEPAGSLVRFPFCLPLLHLFLLTQALPGALNGYDSGHHPSRLWLPQPEGPQGDDTPVLRRHGVLPAVASSSVALRSGSRRLGMNPRAPG
jgi:hypothetical protein